MKTVAVFALVNLASSLLMFGQGSDEQNTVLQTERDLAIAYLNSDADGIARGVTEDYTLTNSTGKITTRADDIDEAKKKDPKYEVFENHDMKVRVHGDTAIVTGQTHTKGTSDGSLSIRNFNSPTHLSRMADAGVCLPAMSQSCHRKKSEL